MNVPAGQQAGLLRLEYHGYLYNRDGHYDGYIQRYVCVLSDTLQRCNAKLWRYYDGEIVTFGIHNHGQPQAHQSLINPIDAENVVNEETEVPRQRAHRRRVLHLPTIPRRVQQLGPILDDYTPINDIYHGVITGTDGSVGFIFGSNQIFQNLNNANELHIDGTYMPVPRTPRMAQLLIIHIRRIDVGIPVLYVLCSHRTIPMYIAMWEYLLTETPGLRDNSRTLVCDFEQALISSARQIFPWIRIRGCWVNFARAITRKWRSLRLPRFHNDLVLRETWALALLPQEMITDGIQLIGDTIRTFEGEFENMAVFFRYLQRFWQPLAHVASVNSAPWRTNNLSENFHHHLVARFGNEHPTLFNFLGTISDIINGMNSRWDRLNLGIDVQYPRRASQRRQDLRIRDLQDSLRTGRCTLRSFLTTAVDSGIHHYMISALSREQYKNDNHTQQDAPRFQDLQDPEFVVESPTTQLIPTEERSHERANRVSEAGGTHQPRGRSHIRGSGRSRGRGRGRGRGRVLEGDNAVSNIIVINSSDSESENRNSSSRTTTSNESSRRVRRRTDSPAPGPSGCTTVNGRLSDPVDQLPDMPSSETTWVNSRDNSIQRQSLWPGDNIFYVGELDVVSEPETDEHFNNSELSTRNFGDVPAEEGKTPCVICQSNMPTSTYSTCGHVCICSYCKAEVELRMVHNRRTRPTLKYECPLCKATSDSIIRLYL